MFSYFVSRINNEAGAFFPTLSSRELPGGRAPEIREILTKLEFIAFKNVANNRHGATIFSEYRLDTLILASGIGVNDHRCR